MAGKLDRPLKPEIMDTSALPLPDTRRALADLESVNRWLLGLGASRRTLRRRIAAGPESQILVDFGTGSGQVSRTLQRSASRAGVKLRVIGVDRKLSHLLFGRDRAVPQQRVVAAAESLPLRRNAADWSFSNLLFHHFTSRGNRLILEEMRRVARRGAVVVDLRQAFAARLLVRILLPLLRVGPVARYDGKLSADQAWSLGKVAELAGDYPVLELRRRFPFRFSLVLEPVAGDPAEPPSARSAAAAAAAR